MSPPCPCASSYDHASEFTFTHTPHTHATLFPAAHLAERDNRLCHHVVRDQNLQHLSEQTKLLSRPGVARLTPHPGVARLTPHSGVTRLTPHPGVARLTPHPGVARLLSHPGVARLTPRLHPAFCSLADSGTHEAPRCTCTVGWDLLAVHVPARCMPEAAVSRYARCELLCQM